MCMVQLGMTNEIQPVDGQLQCNKCRQLLPVDRFHRSSSRKCGYASVCKSCVATRHLDRKAADPEGCAEKSRAATAACRSRKKAAAPPAVARPSTAVMPVDGKLPCADCKLWLPVECFSINRARKCGRVLYCKPCQAVRKAAWRAQNPEYVAEYRTGWRADNAERLTKYEQARYASDPDHHRARSRTRRSTVEGRGQCALWQQQRRARVLGVVNDLTDVQWQSLVAQYDSRCLACGRDDLPLTRDHIVPLILGGALTLSNVQPLCRPCNSSKGDKVLDYRPPEILVPTCGDMI